MIYNRKFLVFLVAMSVPALATSFMYEVARDKCVVHIVDSRKQISVILLTYFLSNLTISWISPDLNLHKDEIYKSWILFYLRFVQFVPFDCYKYWQITIELDIWPPLHIQRLVCEREPHNYLTRTSVICSRL